MQDSRLLHYGIEMCINTEVYVVCEMLSMELEVGLWVFVRLIC